MALPSLLETPRLRLRLISHDDFDFFYQLQSDPETMRYIRPPETNHAVVKERIDMLMKYAGEHPGLGGMVAISKESGVPVANAVLRHVDYQPENDLELGYVIATPFRGMGFATEIAQSIAEYAFERFAVPKVVAVTDPENLLSQKVLLKCGFLLKGRRVIYGSDCLEFELLNC